VMHSTHNWRPGREPLVSKMRVSWSVLFWPHTIHAKVGSTDSPFIHIIAEGYATELIAAAEQELRAMGIQIFSVLIEADNSVSQELFAREGYKAHDVIYMSKRNSDEV
jgi:hypothetical protein